MKEDLRPKKRSRIRQKLGRDWYSLRRYLLWYSGRFRYARSRTEPLPYVQATHSVPLLRKLRDQDMAYQHNKVKNLSIAVPKLDGLCLAPGECLSIWRLVGRPTARKGYVPGMVIENGKPGYGVGGGLCQLSNLLYWLTLHTPLTVVERYRHSFDLFPDTDRTLPFGSGATIVYPYCDLVIRNDTDQRFRLGLTMDDGELRGVWTAEQPPTRRYEIEERDHEMRGEYWGGFTRHNRLYRKVFLPDGSLEREELVAENHAVMMYSPFLGENKET